MKPRSLLRLSLAALSIACTTGLTGCAGHDQKKYNEGYYQSSGDEMKRQFWTRQELERRRYSNADDDGRRAYYTLPGVTQSPDGVRLAPHPVTVPIDE